MFILLHWYCHRGFGRGKMITFTLKIFNIFGDVYTRDGTISLCQRDASAQIVVSHNYRTQVLGSIPFIPSLVTKWHDRHRYLSIHHVPCLMSLNSPRHCSKTLSRVSWPARDRISNFVPPYLIYLIIMKTTSNGNISSLHALCARNSKVIGEFPLQRPVTRSLDVFFDLRLNKWLCKQSRRRWFETPWRSL